MNTNEIPTVPVESNPVAVASVSENTSGMGEASIVPEEVKGFSWGGLLLTWIWGIGNSTWIAFLSFAPIIGNFMWVVLGFKGREWAWRNKKWASVAEFKRVQKNWAIGGVLLNLLIVIPLIGILYLVGILASINPSEQTNKTRDAMFKNDTAEIFSATERYFSIKGVNAFVFRPNAKIDVKEFVPKIVEAEELKAGFLQKAMFTSSDPSDFVYLKTGALEDGSEKVCFVPKAKDKDNLTSTVEVCVPEN